MLCSFDVVKLKGCKADFEEGYALLSIQTANEQNISLDNFEKRSRGENAGRRTDPNNLDYMSSSATGFIFDLSDSMKKLSVGGGSSGSGSNHFCSESFNDEVLDNGCLDDWEAVADALNANDHQHNTHSLILL